MGASLSLIAGASAFQTLISDQEINALAEQPDGKILVGGDMNVITGSDRINLVRLDRDGFFDTTFQPDPNDEVHCVAVQNDGRIIVGGRFTMIAGELRVAIARLEPDGTLDPSLLAHADDTVRAIAIQKDGKIVIAGDFNEVGGTVREGIARLLSTGQLGAPPVQSFADWAEENLPPGSRGEDDRNGPLGIKNLIAYGLGVKPAEFTASELPQASRSPSDPSLLSFKYTRSKLAENISWEVHSSTALRGWIPTLLSETKLSEDSERECWEAVIDVSEIPTIFVSLKVTLNP